MNLIMSNVEVLVVIGPAVAFPNMGVDISSMEVCGLLTPSDMLRLATECNSVDVIVVEEDALDDKKWCLCDSPKCQC